MTQVQNLSKSAKTVQDALIQQGLPFNVVELSASTHTANDAALALNCEVAQIIKSLLFRTQKTNQPILILACGVNRVNEKVIEHIIGEPITKADADFTREITGFAIGGVPPIEHKQNINHILIDEDLLKFETLWAAAGTPNAVFSLNSKILGNLIPGKICTIK